MRRISTGQVGDTVLGTLVTEDNTVRPLDGNNKLILNGNTVEVNEHLEITGDNSMRVYNGSNYVDVNAPSLSSIVNFTLPADTGTTGHVLSTDGSGNLSYVDISIEVANQTADNDTYYPLLSTSNSGSISSVDTSSSKLSFQPSSGTLTADNISGNLTGNVTSSGTSTFSTVDINGGNIDDTVIGGATAAAGTFTTLTETSSLIYKENIAPISGALDTIKKLNGVTYNRKTNQDVKESGLIAEEVAEIIPEIVAYKNGNPDSISYTKLTAYLIESVKSLSKEIEILREK